MPATNPEYMPVYVTEEETTVVARAATPYWLQPFFLIFCCLGLPTLVTFLLPAEVFQTEWHTPKIFSERNALTVAYTIVAFGLGAGLLWFWRQFVRRRGYRMLDLEGSLLERDDILKPVFFIASALTLLGSFVWAVYSARQGVGFGDAVAALRGDSEAVLTIRDKAATIPGITTFTQLGMAAGVLAGLLWFRSGNALVRGLFAAIVLAAFLRAFLRAERLALIEVMLPFCVSLLPELIARWRNAFLRVFLLIVPGIAVAALVGFFIIAEAGRSYEAKLEAGMESSAVKYGANRIGGYYGTALNNGAYLLTKLPPVRMPYFTLEWFWKFPGVSSALSTREMTGFDSDQVFQLLTHDMNIEFNNTSGIFCYEQDFGRAGVVVVAFFVGILSLSLFYSYRDGGGAGRLLYPMCVLAFAELARIPYITSGRAFPSVALLIVLMAIDSFLRISAKARANAS
jgi:hypothetical protein